MKKRLIALLFALMLVASPFIVGCDALADRSHPWTDDKGIVHDRKSCDWETRVTYLHIQTGMDRKGNPTYSDIPQYHKEYECVYY